MKHDVIHSNSCSSVLWSSVTSRPAASTCSTTEPRSKLQTWNRVLKEEMSSKLKRRSVIGLDQQNHHLLCSSVELLASGSGFAEHHIPNHRFVSWGSSAVFLSAHKRFISEPWSAEPALLCLKHFVDPDWWSRWSVRVRYPTRSRWRPKTEMPSRSTGWNVDT